MHWLDEDPTYVIMLGLLLTGFFASIWFMSRRRIFAALGILTFALMIGLVITERVLITDREQIRKNLFDLAAAVEANDVSGVLTHISRSTPKTANRVRNEMPSYDFRDCAIVGINDLTIPQDPDPFATVEFVVRVDVNATQTHQFDGWGMRRVVLTYKKEAGKWKIVDYLHTPLNVGSNLRL